MSISECCLKGFEWDGTPAGKEGTLANNKAYITGDNKDVAVLYIHDILGWTYPNSRLLADHYAREAGATVFIPDFFGGAVFDPELILAGRFSELPLQQFAADNSKEARTPEIIECAKALRSQYKRVIAVGFCYGGWSSFVLGAKGQNLIDALAVGHPSWLTKEEIDAVDVPVQVLAPEVDPQYSEEMKLYTVTKLQEKGTPFSYEYFPGQHHGFATRGDGKDSDVGKALVRGKNAVVAWIKQWSQ